MKSPLSYKLTLGGLVALAIIFPVWLYGSTPSFGVIWSASGAVVPALLLYACWFKTRNWSGLTALCMIPLAVIGMMDIVATLGEPNASLLLGVVSIGTFFMVLDAGRRAPN